MSMNVTMEVGLMLLRPSRHRGLRGIDNPDIEYEQGVAFCWELVFHMQVGDDGNAFHNIISLDYSSDDVNRCMMPDGVH